MPGRSPQFSFHIGALFAAQQSNARLYHEFLRVPDMSAGLYVLPVGGTDPQQPHTEDEMYYIVRGRGKFTYHDQLIDVSEGSVIYVPRLVEHRFHSIEEELVIIVFFAPQEGSRKP